MAVAIETKPVTSQTRECDCPFCGGSGEVAVRWSKSGGCQTVACRCKSAGGQVADQADYPTLPNVMQVK